jgi:DNA-binding MarR family transcriptional regulator
VSPTLDIDNVARLRLAVLRLGRKLRQEAQAGITPSQLSALATIARSGPLPLRDLAGIENIAPSTLTRVVAALEDDALVERLRDPADRRVCLIAVTEGGHVRLDQVRRRATTYLGDRLAALTQEEQEALAAAVPVLEKLLGDDR